MEGDATWLDQVLWELHALKGFIIEDVYAASSVHQGLAQDVPFDLWRDYQCEFP